jgi:hypothetical protein
MGNTRNCAAMMMARAGLVGGLAIAATPALACFDWGYSGVYSHGWPYANTGFASYPASSYRSCGGTYHIPGWGECGGYGACGWAPFPAPVLAAPVLEAPVVLEAPATDAAATVPDARMTAKRRHPAQPQ